MMNNDVLYFTSLDEYLDNDDYNDIFNDKKVMEVKPYTLLKIEDGKIDSFDLYRKKERKKALIIASSGLDSTVCISWAKDQGYDVSLLHFKYKCRAEKKELEHIRKIKDFYNCELVEIDTNFFKDVIKHSKLVDDNSVISENEKGAELAIEWVPARNLIFMSIAGGYAEAHNFDYIILGGNLEESGSYPDNELIFQKKFNDILPNALNLQNKVEILTPIANLMKHEIVKMGIENGAPLHLTWSCYENNDIPCGKCAPDFMRRTAFKMNGVVDMQKYNNDFDWSNCNEIKLTNDKWRKNDKTI